MWRLWVLTIMVISGCADPPISTLSYDTSRSAGSDDLTADGDDDTYPTIDACWLSGEKLSVFVARLTEAPILGTIECPDPRYHDDWAQAGADLIANAAGKRPADRLSLVFLYNTQVPYHEMLAGEELLVGARYYAPHDAWIVVEAVGVSLNGDTGATTDTGWRTVDLPTSWGALVAALSRDRGRDCGRKAFLGTVSEDVLVQTALKPGYPCTTFVPSEPAQEDSGMDIVPD